MFAGSCTKKCISLLLSVLLLGPSWLFFSSDCIFFISWHLPLQRIFGLARKGRIALGYDADLTVVDLKSKREITEADQAQMRRNEARLLRKHLNVIFTQEPGARILAYGVVLCVGGVVGLIAGAVSLFYDLRGD